MAGKNIVPKLKELEYELKEVDWYELGIHMNVPAHTLKNIGKDIASEARRLAEVLHYWLNNGEASWEAVVQALKRIGGHGNIIKTIEWEYFPSTKTVTEASVAQDSTRLNEKDHHTKLLDVLAVHASKWRVIGTYLGFTQSELEIIQSRPMLLTQAPLSYLNEMLSMWYQWAPGDGRGSEDFATLGALKHALSHAGRGRTAAELTI